MNAYQKNKPGICDCGQPSDKRYIVGNSKVCKRCYDSYQIMKAANHTRGKTCGHASTNSFIEPYTIHISNHRRHALGLL